MSYANGTPNYNLPQTVSTDKRDWSDTNTAFLAVDAALKSASDNATQADGKADAAQTTADSAATTAASAVTTANSANATAQTAAETAQLAQNAATTAQQTATQAATDAQSAVSTATAAQQTASNADTVALQAQSDIGTMSNLQTVNKSTLVAAINEVLGKVGVMPELDFANTQTLSTSSITTSKAGCVVMGVRSSGLIIDGTTFNIASAPSWNALTSLALQYIPSGTTLSLSAEPSHGAAYFIPYK